MRAYLEDIDRQLFLALNGLHQDFLDPLMFLISHKLFWIPFYALLIYLVQRKHGWKNTGFFLLGIIVLITMCDQLSSGFFKPLFARYRPCNNLEIRDQVHRVLNGCGSGFSFISGHATNFFGLAMFCGWVIGDKRFHVFLIVWAALIAYSRIYLGVHYPSDIIAGSILGASIGTMLYYFYKRFALQRASA